MPTFSGIVIATGNEATGRRTLLDVVDELSRPVDASDTTIRAMAADAFRAAVRTMNRKGLWPWEVQEEDINITASNSFSTATGAIKKPLAMHRLSGAAGVRERQICYVPYPTFMETYNQNVSGDPSQYTIPNLFETGQIQWFTIPSTSAYARFTYYRVTPAPKAEDEVIEIPDYATEVYMSRAWYEFCKRLSSAQRPFPIEVALGDFRLAFRELSAHVASPGDRSREVPWNG